MNDQERQQAHKQFAVDLFNQTWDLIEKQERSQGEIDRMIHAAHASCYHWEVVGTGVNLARGEWLISRVYALLDRAEPGLYHAGRCLQITLENGLKDFDLAFAYEAMARAASLNGDKTRKAKFNTLAEEAAAQIKDPGDRQYFLSELQTIPPG